MSKPAAALHQAKRAIGFSGFFVAAILAYAIARSFHIGPLSLYGAPLNGLGVGGLVSLYLHATYIPRALRRGGNRRDLRFVGFGIIVALGALLPLSLLVGFPHTFSASVLFLLIAGAQLAYLAGLSALFRR